jgi:hypothetical protein
MFAFILPNTGLVFWTQPFEPNLFVLGTGDRGGIRFSVENLVAIPIGEATLPSRPGPIELNPTAC